MTISLAQVLKVDFQRFASESEITLSISDPAFISPPYVPQLFDLIVVTLMLRAVDFSTHTSVALSTNPITTVCYQSGDAYIDYSLVNAPDNSYIDTSSGCMMAQYSLPLSGLANYINGDPTPENCYYNQNYLDYDYIYSPELLSLFIDTATYPTTQFNCHVTITILQGANNTTVLDGTPVQVSASVTQEQPRAMDYVMALTPNNSTYSNDICVFGYMITYNDTAGFSGGSPSPATYLDTQAKITFDNTDIGTNQDVSTDWTYPGESLAYAVSTQFDVDKTGTQIYWYLDPAYSGPGNLYQSSISLGTNYTAGPTTALNFTITPDNAYTLIGDTVTYTAAYTGGQGVPVIQWQLSTDGGNTWANILGATSLTYTTFPLSEASSGYYYRIVVSDDS